MILRQQICHGLSSVRKKAGLKSSIIIFLHTPTQLNLIGNQRKPFYLVHVRARKCQRKKPGYLYRLQITTRPHLSCQLGFSLFIVDLIH